VNAIGDSFSDTQASTFVGLLSIRNSAPMSSRLFTKTDNAVMFPVEAFEGQSQCHYSPLAFQSVIDGQQSNHTRVAPAMPLHVPQCVLWLRNTRFRPLVANREGLPRRRCNSPERPYDR